MARPEGSEMGGKPQISAPFAETESRLHQKIHDGNQIDGTICPIAVAA
jgi:hypothetical protein